MLKPMMWLPKLKLRLSDHEWQNTDSVDSANFSQGDSKLHVLDHNASASEDFMAN